MIKLENVFMKHYAHNYTLASKQNISLIKAKPKSTHTFISQWHHLSINEKATQCALDTDYHNKQSGIYQELIRLSTPRVQHGS